VGKVGRKVGLTLDDDGGLKQKKIDCLSDDYFLPSFNLRPVHALCHTRIILEPRMQSHPQTTYIVHRGKIEEHNKYRYPRVK